MVDSRRSGITGLARVLIATLVVLAAAVLFSGPVAAAVRPGSIDRDLTVPGRSTIESLGVTADGRITVAGTMRNYFSTAGSWIRVHLADGRLDPSFGTSGQVSFAPPTDLHETGRLVTVPQPDGRVLFATLEEPLRPLAGPPAFTLSRLTRTGEPDLEFGKGGSVTPDFGTGIEVTDLALQPDGMIVAAGVRQGGIVLARLLPDGTWDRGFGEGGVASLAIESPGSAVVAVQPRFGTIVLASTGSGPRIARFLPEGSVDPDFGSGRGCARLRLRTGE